MIFTLLAGLLLPWITGCLWLAAIRQYQGHAPHAGRLPRLLGYGFFLGYALLYGIVIASNALLGRVSMWTTLVVVTALAVLGIAVLLWVRRRHHQALLSPPDDNRAMRTRSGVERILTWLLLALLPRRWPLAALLPRLLELVSRATVLLVVTAGFSRQL